MVHSEKRSEYHVYYVDDILIFCKDKKEAWLFTEKSIEDSCQGRFKGN